MVQRKGLMKGKGRGYKNVIGKDPYVHSQSARGIKQPQNIKNMFVNVGWQGFKKADKLVNIDGSSKLPVKRDAIGRVLLYNKENGYYELSDRYPKDTDADGVQYKNIKDYYRDLRKDFDKLTTSDLQGVIYVKAKNIIKDFNIPDEKQMEIEDLLIEYAQGDLDLNSTKRYILDLIPQQKKESEPYYMEDNIPLINDGGQTPPPQ